MVIDAHAHLGGSAISGLEVSSDQLLGAMDEAGIDAAIVQPFPHPSRPAPELHDAIAELAQKHRGRIYGLASISPHLPEEEYAREAERCIGGLGFVGIKLHPLGHLAPIRAASSDIVFATCARLGVPIMIHTGFGVPFTLPSLAIPRARQYPDLTIVLAHAGESLYSGEAVVAAEECPNVYLETSWSKPGEIRGFITKLGSGRVMMGTDLPDNARTEMAKYRSIAVDDADRKRSLGETARDVFGLKDVVALR